MPAHSLLLNAFILTAASFPSVIAQYFTPGLNAPSGVNAGDSVNITWMTSSNPSNLNFCVLLKQGDPSRFGANWVVRIINSGDAPNTGSFKWNVANDLPQGSNYYIRLQTGLPTDWEGGLGLSGSGPTQHDVYGITSLFTLSSSIPSTSYASPTLSITSIPSPSDGSASRSANSTTSRTLSPRKIAGTVVGGVALLVLCLLVTVNLSQLTHWFYSLPLVLFGVFLLPGRRLIFRADKDLGQTQITLVLQDKKAGTVDAATSRQVFWRVFYVGNSEPDFILDIPCQNNAPALGFATINDNPHGLLCEAPFPGSAIVSSGPAQDIILSPGDPKAKLSIRNESDIPHKLALGTFVVETTDQIREKAFYPFLVGDVDSGTTYEPDTSLYIHAFETLDCGESKYAEHEKLCSRLTPEGGIDLSRLHPLTTWNFSRRANGLVLKIGKNSRKDIKNYQHVCKVSNEIWRK